LPADEGIVVPVAEGLAPEALAVPEPPELLVELPAALNGVPETLGLPPAAAAPLPVALASLEPPQPARATLRVTSARPWPSHPRFFPFFPFFPLFMSLAPLFR